MNSIIIKQFDKQSIEMMRTEIQSALDHIKTKYGLSELKLETINYQLSSFSSKISGIVENEEMINYKQNEAKFFAAKNGLPPDFIGSEFAMDRDVFTITHLVTSRPKYPITAHCKENGKTLNLLRNVSKNYWKNIESSPLHIKMKKTIYCAIESAKEQALLSFISGKKIA